ncbi:MAG TPA: Na+-transporting oxaloacetate decarboxylase subunit gamma [Epsilonproteobacteria bacterium]|mgnify:CR=1 FL=1|nr:Na+-transporting oxaloacetate decarboxylase subunit gamma [Campylobacterota bacterium]
MELHLVEEATKFMLLGMGIVFLFLYILVLLMQLQAKIINRFFPEKPSTPVAQNDSENNAHIAAIIAAIAEYRKH